MDPKSQNEDSNKTQQAQNGEEEHQDQISDEDITQTPERDEHKASDPNGKADGKAEAPKANNQLSDGTARSRRERKPTEKIKELQEQDQRKREQKFHAAYEKWKQEVKAARIQLKSECTEQGLDTLMGAVEKHESQVLQTYNAIREHGAPSHETKQRMDACTAVTRDVISLMQHRLTEVDEEWDERAERLRLHSLLDRNYAQSVYGSLLQTSTAPSAITVRSQWSHKSEKSSIAAKRAETAAQLAAKQAKLEATEEEDAARAKLKQSIEVQRHEIKRLETQKEIKVTKAKMDVYDKELEHLDQHNSEDMPQPRPTPNAVPEVITSPPVGLLRPECPEFIPGQSAETTAWSPQQPADSSVQKSPQQSDYTSLAQALQSTMMLGRLPPPEPTVFYGDPLQYTE